MTSQSRRNRSGHVVPFTSAQITSALVIMGTFILSMAAWSSLAPIGSAVIASGVVAVETHRKAIQHLEGGIVGRILVKDGTKVRRGDVLVELRDVAIVANVERLTSQYYETLASYSRLAAERDGLADIVFVDELVRAATNDPVAASAIQAQLRIFRTRRDLLTQKIAVIDKRIDRLTKEGEGLDKQIDAVDAQVAITEEERRDARALYEKQLTRKTRVLDAQRSKAQLDERRSGLESVMSQTVQQISELQLKRTELMAATLTEVVEELRLRQARAHEISRELIAARDILARTRIRAPLDGTVVGLQIHSRDGVIAPGQTLLEIVPDSDALVVEARVRPEDIEEIRGGLAAQVVLNTLTRRYNKPINGLVETVSADRVIDKLTGRPFYAVRVSLQAETVAPGDSKLLAGMSADVFIQTGERTVLAYLAAPLLRTFHRGMRES